MREQNDVSRILRDTTPASMTKAIEDSLEAFPLSLAQLPGAEIYNKPDLLWVATDMPISIFNGVYRCILDEQSVDARIEEIKEEFRSRQLPLFWQIGPSSRPADLRQRLLAHSFTHEEDEPGMALDLLAMNEAFPELAELHIRVVDEPSALHRWVEVWGFGVPEDRRPLYQEAYARLGFGPQFPWRYYIGDVQGKPVATALLFFGAGVVALHNVVTLPEARYKGIGTAITLAALRDARREGYRVAILTSSPYGERIYRRIGFREYCTISRYNWQP